MTINPKLEVGRNHDKYLITNGLLIMKINDINESSTTSGAIAPVASPMTKMQTRTVGQGVYGKKGRKPGNLFTGKKTNKPFANSISEGKMKDLAYDLDNLSSSAFNNKYKQSKEEMRASVGSAEPKAAKETEPKFTTKQQVINHFVKIGKTKEQGARAWERGFRGSKPKDAQKKSNVPADKITESKVESPSGSQVKLDPNKFYVWAWDGRVVVYGKYDSREEARQQKQSIEDRAVKRLGPYAEGNFKVASGSDLLSRYVKETRLEEDDLIIVPGMRKSKDKSFVPHKEDRRDHEVQMARSDLYATAKNAMRIFDLLKERSEDQGIMGWQQSYITLAADYLNSVAESMEFESADTNEMTGGVIAGGGVGEGAVDEALKRKIDSQIQNESLKKKKVIPASKEAYSRISSDLYNKAAEEVGNRPQWKNKDFNRSYDNSVAAVHQKHLDNFVKKNPAYAKIHDELSKGKKT